MAGRKPIDPGGAVRKRVVWMLTESEQIYLETQLAMRRASLTTGKGLHLESSPTVWTRTGKVFKSDSSGGAYEVLDVQVFKCKKDPLKCQCEEHKSWRSGVYGQ